MALARTLLTHHLAAELAQAFARAERERLHDLDFSVDADGVGPPLGIMLTAADRNAGSPHPAAPESRQVRRARERAQRK